MRWARSAEGRRRREVWADRHPALAGWTLEELTRPDGSERTDAMQAALVELAQHGEDGAAATLVVQLRPGLQRLAGRVAATDPRYGSVDDAAAEVLSVVSERILAHRLDRRPARIAANLILDTRQQIWRAGVRHGRVVDAARAAAEVAPTPAGPGPDAPTAPEAAVGRMVVVAAVRDALDDLPGTDRSRRMTAELAWRAWFLDQPSTEIAAELGLSRTMISARLYRLRSRVRSRLSAAA
ncbi:MAG: RNA polymerase sigma factor [Acidimicrobiales bacterium]